MNDVAALVAHRVSNRCPLQSFHVCPVDGCTLSIALLLRCSTVFPLMIAISCSQLFSSKVEIVTAGWLVGWLIN